MASRPSPGAARDRASCVAARQHRGAIDDDYDLIGVIVAAAVLLALPIFESSADPFAGLIGGAVGGLAGLAASALRDSH